MSIYNIRAIKDTFVFNDKLAKPQCHSPYLPVGKIGSGFIKDTNYISYVFFNLAEVPENQVVSKAALYFYFFAPPFLGLPPEYLGIQLLAGPFKDCGTDFYNRPPIIPGILKIIPINHKSNCLVIPVTDFVKAYRTGRVKNFGFALVPVYKGTNGVLLFHSSYGNDKLKQPLLKVKTFTGNPANKINWEKLYAVKEQATYSSTVEVWNYSVFSFIAKNIGSENVLIKLQDSPDNQTFIDEEPEIELVPGQSKVMVSNFFTRYLRLKFRLKVDKCAEGSIMVWAQGRQ